MKYEVDERGGCIAVVRTDTAPPSEGLHSSDHHIIKYWLGVDVAGKIHGKPHVCWHVPGYRVKRAHRVCDSLNL